MPDRKGMTVGGVSPPAGFSLLSSLVLAQGSRETDTALTFFTLTHNFLNTFRMSSFIKQPVHLPGSLCSKKEPLCDAFKALFLHIKSVLRYRNNNMCRAAVVHFWHNKNTATGGDFSYKTG